MKINNKGFGLVEGLLIVLVISVLSFGGWYVYNNNWSNSDENTSQSSLDNSGESNIDESNG